MFCILSVVGQFVFFLCFVDRLSFEFFVGRWGVRFFSRLKMKNREQADAQTLTRRGVYPGLVCG